MNSSQNCPLCYRDSRYCGCGYTPTPNNEKSARSVLPILIFSFFIMAAFIHSVNWNEYFLTIIPLKMKELTGLASSDELKQIAQICLSRKKATCEVNALEKAYSLNTKEFNGLARAGEIHMAAKRYEDAIRVYGNYFKSGGKDRGARYQLALALKNGGHNKDAKKQFQYLVRTEGSNPDYDIARDYVEILIGDGDLRAAHDVIAKYRGFRKSAGYFLEKEWNFIEGRISNSATQQTAKNTGNSPFNN